jgi:hypothetical protein
MESELDLLLGTVVDSLCKLELLLYFHHRAGAVGGAEQVGTALGRPVTETAAALAALATAGLVDRFALGTGRHVIYGATEDARVKDLVALLYRRYHQGGESRLQLLRQILRAGETGDHRMGAEDAERR